MTDTTAFQGRYCSECGIGMFSNKRLSCSGWCRQKRSQRLRREAEVKAALVAADKQRERESKLMHQMVYQLLDRKTVAEFAEMKRTRLDFLSIDLFPDSAGDVTDKSAKPDAPGGPVAA